MEQKSLDFVAEFFCDFFILCKLVAQVKQSHIIHREHRKFSCTFRDIISTLCFHLGHSQIRRQTKFNINTHSLTCLTHINRNIFSHSMTVENEQRGNDAYFMKWKQKKQQQKIDPFKHPAYDDGWITTTTKITKTKCPNGSETHFNKTNGARWKKQTYDFYFYYNYGYFWAAWAVYLS